MHALVKTEKGKGNLALWDVPEPEAGPGEVKLRIEATGICGTDVHIRDDHFHYNPPVILGHEFVGRVVAVGAGVEGIPLGTRYVAEPHKGGCGKCRFCLTGAVEACAKKKALGYRIDGSFCPYVTLPLASLHAIPDHLDTHHAACAEPLAVGVKAVLERSRVEPEDVVVVLGVGPIGLLAGAAAKAAGARLLIGVGTDADEPCRYAVAKAMGFDRTVNVQKEKLKTVIDELTAGTGADLVVEASGAGPAIATAFDILRIDGRVSAIGLCSREEIAVPWNLAVKKAAQVTFSFSSSWTSWERSVSLLATGRVDVRPLITHRIPLEQWAEGFAALDRNEAAKVLLLP